MTTVQNTLFDELDAVAKKPHEVARPLILTKDDLVPSGDGIVFPCVVARRLPLEERPGHMSICNACKSIEKELDESVGVFQEHGVWY